MIIESNIWYKLHLNWIQGFAGGSDGKNLPAMSWDWGLIPKSGKFPGEGNGNPFQHSCLENSTGRRARQDIAHRVTKEFGHDWVTNTFTFKGKYLKTYFTIIQKKIIRRTLGEQCIIWNGKKKKLNKRNVLIVQITSWVSVIAWCFPIRRISMKV